MICPSTQELTNYIVEAKENKEIETHLLHCDRCMDTVILSQKTPKVNNIQYKAFFTLVAASLLLFLISFNFNPTTDDDFSSEVALFDSYLEDKSIELNSMWELTANSIHIEEYTDSIELFSEDDTDVFDI